MIIYIIISNKKNKKWEVREMLNKIREAVKIHERIYDVHGKMMKCRKDNSLNILGVFRNVGLNSYRTYLEIKYNELCSKAGLIVNVNRDIIVDMVNPIFLGLASTTVNISFTIERSYLTAIVVSSGSKPTLLISDIFLEDRPINVLTLLIGVMHEAQHYKQHKTEIRLATFDPDSTDYFFHPTEIEARAVSYAEESCRVYERMIKSIPRR